MFVFLISSLILRSKIESVWHPFMRKGYGRRASVAEGNGAIAEPVVARPTLAAVALRETFKNVSQHYIF